MISQKDKKDLFSRVYEDQDIWMFDLSGYSKITKQYYCGIHERRAKNLLGDDNFKLNFKLSPDGKLLVSKKDFEKLSTLFEEKIIKNPNHIRNVINRRRNKLQLLKNSLISDEYFLKKRKYKKCNPLKVFVNLIDFASFYLEFNFPQRIFRNLLIEKLHYTEDDYNDLFFILTIPTPSSYSEYYKGLLDMSLSILEGREFSLSRFKEKHAFIGARDFSDIEFKTNEEIFRQVNYLLSHFKYPSSIRDEMRRIFSIQKEIKGTQERVIGKLREKSKILGSYYENLIVNLADLLMESIRENEEICYWRGRAFAYFKKLLQVLKMDLYETSIEELNFSVRKL